MKAYILSFIFFGILLSTNLFATVTPLKDAAVLHGKVRASKKCNSPAVIWVSKNREILYQVEVPIKGSYEFHLKPGEYDITASNSSSCLAKKNFILAKNESKTLDLTLSK